MIACFAISEFAIAAHRRIAVPLPGAPVVLARYGTQRGTVAALSSKAEDFGIKLGMPLNRARALCPTAQFVTLDNHLLDKALDQIFRFLWTFTNRVELSEGSYPQTLVCYLDLGSLNDEGIAFLGKQIIADANRELALTPALGVSIGKFTAYVASIVIHPGQMIVIPAGEEPAFIGPQPIRMLPLGKETKRRLDLFYIETVGQFADLPSTSILSQFGKEGRLLHQLARALDSRPVVPKRMPPVESALRKFDEPLNNRLGMNAVMSDLSMELSQRLDARVAALHEVNLTLTFEDGSTRVEDLHLLQPIASAGAIGQTLNQLLDRASLHQAIERVEVTLTHLVPNVPRQMELFTHKPARQQLIELAHVLAERHGPNVFYEGQLAERASLVPERRFRLLRLSAS